MNAVSPAHHDAAVSVVRHGPDWIADAVSRLDRLDGLWLVSRGFAPADRDRLCAWLHEPAPEPVRQWQEVESYDAVLESMQRLAQGGGDGLAVMRVSLFLRATVHTEHRWSVGVDTAGGAVACLLCAGDTELEAIRRQADLLDLGIMEVANPQQFVDHLPDAFTLSRAHGRVTVLVLDETLWRRGGSLRLAPRRDQSASRKTGPQHHPPRTRSNTRTVGQRQLDELYRTHTRLTYRPNRDDPAPLAIITPANALDHVMQGLDRLGLTRQVPVLSLGVLHPWRPGVIERLHDRCGRVLVMDAATGWLTMHVAHALAQWQAGGGRAVVAEGCTGQPDDPADAGRVPRSAEQVAAQVARTLRSMQLQGAAARLITPGLEAFEQRQHDRQHQRPDTVISRGKRPSQPSACTGCDTCTIAALVGDLMHRFSDTHYMLNRHSRKPLTLRPSVHAGCPSVHVLDGLSDSLADPDRAERRVDVFSVGQVRRGRHTRIADAAREQRDHLFLLLDEHQPTRHALRQQHRRELERFLLASVPAGGRRHVDVIHANPSERARFARLLERAAIRPGVQVIVVPAADLAQQRRTERDIELDALDSKGFVPRQQLINPDPFAFGGIERDGLGPKVVARRTDTSVFQEQVTIYRERPAPLPAELEGLDRLPTPARPIHADQPVWSCQIASGGHFGVRTLGRLLCEAGNAMGYRIALRSVPEPGGRGMTCQVVFDRPPQTDDKPARLTDAIQPGEIPRGHGDVILAMDCDGAGLLRGLDAVADADRTAAVIDTPREPSRVRQSRERGVDAAQVETLVRARCHEGRVNLLDAYAVSRRVFGSTRYVNQILLGLALQRGYLPLTPQVIDQAMVRVFHRDRERNRLAMQIGRALAVNPEAQQLVNVVTPNEPSTLLDRESRLIAVRRNVYGGRRRARRFRLLVRRAMRGPAWRGVGDELKCDFIRCASDVMLVGGLDLVRSYTGLVPGIVVQDTPDQGFELTRQAVWGLARAMCVMDDAAIAARLTDPAKIERDRRRLGILPARGDRVVYRYPMATELVLFGQNLRFEWTARPEVLWWLAAAGPVLRRVKSWYGRERRYRDWYIELIRRCSVRSAWDYQRWCEALGTVQSITGYREARVASMTRAMRRAEALLDLDEPVGGAPPGQAMHTTSAPASTTAQPHSARARA